MKDILIKITDLLEDMISYSAGPEINDDMYRQLYGIRELIEKPQSEDQGFGD